VPRRDSAGGASAGGALRGAAHPREVDLERRPMAGLAVDPDVTAALLHDAEDRREPEARALAELLRGEEGLEDARLRSSPSIPMPVSVTASIT
jgi:hypothetical protein